MAIAPSVELMMQNVNKLIVVIRPTALITIWNICVY